jgi:hypothetical protein
MKQTLNRTSIVLILALANINIVQAQHGIVQGDISWFTSNTSSLLNRSSVALATNHTNRGIQFAYRALVEKLKPMDELVAYHNLCIGYLASDRPEYAAEFCANAKELAQGPYSVVKTRGAFKLQGIDGNNTAQTKLSAMQVIVSNIQQQNLAARISLLMK